jgi:hypothetical protein
MSLREARKFQKTLALAAAASNVFEAEAAERAARRLMRTLNIDPVLISDRSLYDHGNFAENALLKKLRAEWREQHPRYFYKTSKDGSVRRLRRRTIKCGWPGCTAESNHLFTDGWASCSPDFGMEHEMLCPHHAKAYNALAIDDQPPTPTQQ